MRRGSSCTEWATEWLKERAAEITSRRGRALQRGSRRHERDRDCAGRRPRLSGVRLRALQRTPSPVDLLRRSGARPGIRPDDRTDRPLEPLEDRASTEPGAGDHRCQDDRAVPPGCPARSRRSAETSLRRSHDEEHGSAREPRRLRARRRRAGALEAARRSGGWWRGRSGRRVGCGGGATRSRRGVPPPPSHRAPRQVGTGRGARACRKARSRARHRTGRPAAGRDPRRARVRRPISSLPPSPSRSPASSPSRT